ncbi:MAG: hypothetical protein Q4D48_07490, partial [Coriobacteriales bacterium]|nr:hypothetical protein [Coriobacteriales bacterium]
MPVLTEDEPIEINLEENEQWVGKFTAPYDGTFTFSSTGHWDAYGILFADEELSDWLTDNTYGSGANGFSISWNLVEGETVYLMVLDFYDRAMSCTVTASYGISLSSFECNGTSTLVYDGQPKTPSDVEIGRFGDELYEPLTPGVDYEFIGWADGHTGEQLADEPYEMGNYYAVYEGRGEYIGRYYFPYQIVDGCHLDFGSVWLHEREYLSTGNPVVLDVTVKDAAGNELDEGEDFYFAYYREGYYEVDDGNGGTDEQWGFYELEGAPSAPGEYYVRALAMGDTYEGGSDYCPFTIKNAKDLYLGRVDLYNQYYETSGDPIEIEATVYDAAGNELVKGQDYVFEYAYWGEVEVDDGGGVTYPDWGYAPLGSAPSEEGSYYVRAVAIGDEYEGATDWYSFEVGEAYDVYNLEFGYISMSKDTFEVGKELVYDLEIYNGNDEQLIEDVDYRIVGFTTEEGVELDGAPSEVGVYYLVCKGINDYRGTIRIRIVLIEPVNPVDMALGTVDVEIDPNSYWIGIFTAPESGYYSFYSEGDYDTDGYLYSDADLSQYIGGDASGGDGNSFLVTTYLSEGQTVYVQARNCEGVRIGCSVTAIKGARLSALNYTYGQSTFVFDGNPHTPDVTFYDYDDSELVDGTDYCLKHILTDEGEILASAPTEIGTYFAVYEGMGNYLGTMEVQFTIVDSSDLSSATITLNTWHPKLIDGSLDLVVTVTDAAGIELVEGVHYVLSYYTFDDNGNQVSVEAPTTTGQYYVQADAIAGGGYTGSTSAYDFTVVDPHDIGIEDYSCYFNNSSSKLLVDGTFDLSDLTLYNDVEDTYLILGTDYRIAGYIDENGAVFTNPPTVSGWYQVVLRGTGRYTGERTCWFSLYDSNDIGGDAYSCYFRGSFNKPLIDGTFDLSDLTLYNEFEDTYLILGTDYEIAGYRDNYGTILLNPPTEPGWYQVVVRGTGGYTGECTCGFRLYDPYDLTGASVSLRGAIQLYDEASDQYDNYFFYEGSPVEPTIAVYLGNGQLPSSAYTVTYGNNDHVHEAGEYATVTVTGVEPYTESITAKYKVVDALDLESFVYRCNSYVMWDGHRDSVDYTHIEYLATGQPIKPVMEINYYYDGPNSLSDFPELGVDYTCSYEDANGNAIEAARGLGSYTLVVTGMQGGRLSGTMRIPFTLVDTVDLDRYSDVNLVYNGSYTWGGPYHQGFSIHDLATTVSDLAWKLWRDGVQLVENLDYVVEYVGDTVGDMFEVVFHGIGSYTGTVRSVVYFDKTAQDSFDNRSMVRSTVYGFDSYDSYGSVVYVDSTGAIEAPQVTISGLVQGIDYVVDG